VLVRVVATTMTRTDCAIRYPSRLTGRLAGARARPRQWIAGRELAGEVEVFGISPDRLGAHAEFVCLPADAPLAHKPPGVSFEQAAAVSEGAIIALACLKTADLAEGQTIAHLGTVSNKSPSRSRASEAPG